MTPSQLQRRETLLARGNLALQLWPDRDGPDFLREMSNVAEALHALARTADLSSTDELERARTWRHVGNAYFDLGRGRERTWLEQAASAFRNADALLRKSAQPVERIKLDYSFGQTLMGLCDAQDLRLAAAARERFANALRLARQHLPEGAASLEKLLRDAERVVALLTQAEGLGRRIDELKHELKDVEAREANRPPEPKQRAAPPSDEIQAMFGQLLRAFEKEKPDLDPVRRANLEDFVGRLGKLVTSESDEKMLDDMLANRGKLERLIREIQPQGKKPSLKGPGVSAGSRSERILAALQDLKMFVFSTGMQQGTPEGMRNAAIELFPRIGRLTTWISEAGPDAAKVRQLEADQARALAHEVRLFARRAHLMLARPVWPHHRGLVEANRIFFSGPVRVRAAVMDAAAALGLEHDQLARSGADFAQHRWQDLRAANVAVFDLSGNDPQVYYELGIAFAIGAQLLLIAEEDTDIPFDVAQNVQHYAAGTDLREFLADELDGAMYGLHVRGSGFGGLSRTLAYAERLAEADRANALLGVALRSVRSAGSDPVKFQDALNVFNSYLSGPEHEILLPRWPPDYPDPHAPCCFSIMPFRDTLQRAYDVIAEAADNAGVEAVRGDVAEGQQIIESIWSEICRATHVTVDLTDFNPNVCLELGIAHTLGRPARLIGRAGTERALQSKLPGAAKWRCYPYGAEPRAEPNFRRSLEKFLAKVEWK